MKIFISWAGERSKKLALCLEQWLRDVIQSIEVFASPDIRVGNLWFEEIQSRLNTSEFCIACLTPETFRSPWLLFEVGAIANRVGETYSCAYLLDMQPNDLERHPLSYFQVAKADKEGTLRLVQSINASLGSEGLDDARLERAFDKWWDELDAVLMDLPKLDFEGYPNSFYSIHNKAKDLCLEVRKESLADEAELGMVKFTAAPNQLWRFQQAEEGFFFITAKHSRKCMDVKSRDMKAGALVHQYVYKGGDNQQWTVTSNLQEGHYRIAARHSGLFLTARSDGSIHQEERSPVDNQRWKLRLSEQ